MDYNRMIAEYSRKGIMTKEKYINDNVLEVRPFKLIEGQLQEQETRYFDAHTLKEMKH